jgi:hypothetical protein
MTRTNYRLCLTRIGLERAFRKLPNPNLTQNDTWRIPMEHSNSISLVKEEKLFPECHNFCEFVFTKIQITDWESGPQQFSWKYDGEIIDLEDLQVNFIAVSGA